jgi:hypothetical protein
VADDYLADFFFRAREDALEFSDALIGRLFRSRSHPFSSTLEVANRDHSQ